MKKGNYIYYRDAKDTYILKIKRGAEASEFDSFQLIVLSSTTKDFNGHEYIWAYQAFIRDCKETRIITEAEALAKIL